MKITAHAYTLIWLKTIPPLSELCLRYPEQWKAVQQELSTIVERRVAEELQAYLTSATQVKKFPDSRIRNKMTDAELFEIICSRMAQESIKKLCLSLLAADAGVTKGKVRFNLLNGYVAQKLLFSEGLERKPVSMFWFRLFWPLVWQKKRLMPLVQPKGIYCFYSQLYVPLYLLPYSRLYSPPYLPYLKWNSLHWTKIY